MSSVNKVILVGRLGRDPDVRSTATGKKVVNFTLATDEIWTDAGGQRQQRTEWHRIVVWGKQTDACESYLSKGRLVYVEGRLQTREWQDKDGNKRTSVEVVAQNVRFLGGRGEGAGAGPRTGGDRPERAERPSPAAQRGPDEGGPGDYSYDDSPPPPPSGEDEIPF